MATGSSGYFDLTGTKGFTVRVNWSETYDEATNASVVSIDSIQVRSSTHSGYTYYLNGPVTVDGSQVVRFQSGLGSHNVRVSYRNVWYTVNASSSGEYPAAPWISAPIVHNDDGSKEVTIALDIIGYIPGETDGSVGGHGWTCNTSQTITLSKIPRASTVGATDANIGATSIVAVGRKSSNYTHSIQYQFGSLSGYLTESGGTSSTEVKMTATNIPFTVPTAFFAQIPNAKSGVCTLTCRTYSGSVQIGEAQTARFTATAKEEDCKPSVSGTVLDSNAATKALTGDESKLVRHMSTALCTISAEARNGASIATKFIAGTETSGTTLSILNVESGSIQLKARDSRGYENIYTVNAEVIPYVKLSANVTAQRTDPTSGNAVLTVKGDYFNGSFGAAENSLTVQYRINYGEYVPVVPEITGNAYVATADLSGLDYTQSHNLEIVVSDKLSEVTKTAVIRQGIPVFDWGKDYFNFNVPVRLKAGPFIESEDHPGCYYTVVDGEIEWFNPAMVLGVEYRTAERFDGKAVYAKLLDCGTLPNDTYKAVSIGVVMTNVVSYDVVATDANNDWRFRLPYINQQAVIRCMACVVGYQLRIYSIDYDMSGYTGRALIKYTKD